MYFLGATVITHPARYSKSENNLRFILRFYQKGTHFKFNLYCYINDIKAINSSQCFIKQIKFLYLTIIQGPSVSD